MGRITGGELRFLRRIQAAQFEPKEAEARIAFAVDEGEDAEQTMFVVRMAVEKQVQHMLGQAGATVGSNSQVEADGGNSPTVQAAPAARGRGRPPGSPNRPRVDGKPLPDPTDLPGEAPTSVALSENQGNGTGTQTKNSDPTALDPTVAAVVEITDAVLQDRVTKHNAALIAKGVDTPAAKIKALIGTYTGGPPKTARDIPQDKRAGFLLELEKIG
jgi:hypothetical protein